MTREGWWNQVGLAAIHPFIQLIRGIAPTFAVRGEIKGKVTWFRRFRRDQVRSGSRGAALARMQVDGGRRNKRREGKAGHEKDARQIQYTNVWTLSRNERTEHIQR